MTTNVPTVIACLSLSALVLCAAAAPPELEKLQDSYRRQTVALARDRTKTPLERSRGIIDLARTHARQLTELQKQFLRKGKLQEATTVNDEIDRAMADKLLLAAIEVVKKAREDVPAPVSGIELELSRDLVLHYSFEKDPKGFTIDRSKSGNHAQLVGPITYEQTRRGRVVRLNSPRTFIACGSKSLNTDKWPAITLSAWILIKKYTGFGVLMARGEITGRTTGGFLMRIGGRGPTGWRPGRFSVAGSVLEPTTFASGVDPMPKQHRWYHLVGTYDGNEIRFYVNGALDSEMPATKKGALLSDSPKTKLIIGTAPARPHIGWSDMYFDGWLDDVRIWKRALSPAEIKQLFDSENKGP